MTEKSRAKELVGGYSFLVVFANDDTIDEKELAMIERLALEDGVVDDKEKEILRRLLIAWITTQSPAKSWKRSTAFESNTTSDCDTLGA